MSYRAEVMTAIISIAQHARPKPNGHIELDEAQLSAFSSVVVMTTLSRSRRAQRAAHGRGRDDDRSGTRRRGWAVRCYRHSSAPFRQT